MRDNKKAAADKQQILTKLREHKNELHAAGVLSLSLFGSVARGDANQDSDIDLLAEFDRSVQHSILDRVRLENRLTEILGAAVDLAAVQGLREDVKHRAAQDFILAF